MKDFKKSVIYQIYPKSFKDTNNDGIGDINGIIQKLDYIKELGVDYIWITPVYVSPQNDNGYDVADYYNIDPLFGNMSDVDTLIEEAKKRDIYIMLDMVFNHTSTEHQWFKNAINGSKEYKDFYIFKESKDELEPTNWQSKFGGSAWEYVDEFDEYYLHLFDATQADLNWENEKVRNEIYSVINFWLEKGVKGFRFDVINLISKPERYENDNIGDGRRFYTDGPKIHKYIKEMNEKTFGKYDDIITVGEMSSTSVENCVKYSNPCENELSMVFNFHHLKVDYDNGDKWTDIDFDFLKLKDLFEEWQTGLHHGNGWNAVFWCNHDQPRIVSRFGDDKNFRNESAKMLATTIHMLEGTPYIYQGEEIGMTNPNFNNINAYKDIETLNTYEILKDKGLDEKAIMNIIQKKSRDNSRTPMQWNNTQNAGFTEGTPWLSLSYNYTKINAENALKESNSIFYHYKKLINLRKKYDIIAYGDFKIILKNHPQIFAYIRSFNDEKLLVINNFFSDTTTFSLPSDINLDNYFSKVLISNYDNYSDEFGKIDLRPYESIVYHLVK